MNLVVRTAAQLADVLEVSEKTVRIRLKSLNDELKEYGAEVLSKARFGYKLSVIDDKKFESLERAEENNQNYIPDSGKELDIRRLYGDYRRAGTGTGSGRS